MFSEIGVSDSKSQSQLSSQPHVSLFPRRLELKEKIKALANFRILPLNRPVYRVLCDWGR